MAVVGIDLGRASCSAFVLLTGERTTESFPLQVEAVVTLTAKNEWLVGEDARRAAAAGSGEAVWDLLLLQGSKLSDFSTAQLASWPFRLVAGAAGKALVEFQAKPSLSRTVFSPEELLAVLFARLRQLVEQRACCLVEETVLCVPGSYNYTQRRAIRDACAMAGLHARRTVASATAAGLAHALARGEAAVGELVVVVDFGAGSVDVSLVSARTPSSVEVKAAAGDATIGGVVLTERIVGHFLRDCNVQAAVATTKTLNRLRRASQLAKKILTTSDVASVQLQIDTGAFAGSITRSEFEAVCSDCWARVEQLILLVLAEGHASKDQVNTVLLCGGSAVVPAVRDVVQRLFPATAVEVNPTGDLQARGAAMLAASLLDTARPSLLDDVTPLAFGVQRVGAKDVTILIPANVRVPASGDNVFFVGSQTAELTYRVLEGRHLRHATSSPRTSMGAPHCVGTIRALQAPLSLTTTPRPVVTKVGIAFDLTADLQLTASIADLATKQPTTTTFLGDDTLLPRDTVMRAAVELDRIFGGHRAVDKAHTAPQAEKHEVFNGAAAMQPSRSAALLDYAQTLRSMIETKTLAVAISDEDKQLLKTKIEELLAWLHASTDPQQRSPEATNNEHANVEEPLRARLRALRRLHWSIAAAAAIAQLRDESDD